MDILHEKLNEGKSLNIISLPEPEGEPEDENDARFQLELNISKDTDEKFIEEMKKFRKMMMDYQKEHLKFFERFKR